GWRKVGRKATKEVEAGDEPAPDMRVVLSPVCFVWLVTHGITPLHQYACTSTSTPISKAKTRLCQNTNRRIAPSCPLWPVAAAETTMLWASIILPMTPPVLLALARRIMACVSPSGSTPVSTRRRAVIVCRLPNRALEDVSEPVSATPSQPSRAADTGYSQPVLVNARPSVASIPL